jgi:hypothetical protein
LQRVLRKMKLFLIITNVSKEIVLWPTQKVILKPEEHLYRKVSNR